MTKPAYRLVWQSRATFCARSTPTSIAWARVVSSCVLAWLNLDFGSEATLEIRLSVS